MIYLGVIGIVFLTDFLVKKYIERKYARKVRHPRLKNKIMIEKYYNDGATLNLLAKHPKIMTALHTAVIFLIAVPYAMLLRRSGKSMTKTGIALVLGGGLNNLFDRYTKGHVVDYVRFAFGPEWFQNIIFNMSDFFIFIGAILVVIAEGKGQ